MGKELASMRPRCVDRKKRPLSPRTNPMEKRRAAGAAVDIGKEQPSLQPRCLDQKPRPRKKSVPRNRRRTVGMSVCSECRPTPYGKALASVRPQCLDRKQAGPRSPRRKQMRSRSRHPRRVDNALAQCGRISAFHSAWERRSQHEAQAGPTRLDELGRPTDRSNAASRLRSVRLRARRRQQGQRLLMAAALCEGACKRG